MEKEFIIIIVETDMRANLKMIIEKVKEFFIIRMEKNMKDSFMKANQLEHI